IATIATIVSRVESRLAAVTRQTEEQQDTWQKSLADLERESTDIVKSARWLSHQNQELERKLAQQKPELNNAIDAREASFRKLRHARKVIRDLVIDNEKLQIAAGLRSSQSEDDEQEEMKKALEESLAISISSGSASDGEATARQQRPSPQSTVSLELSSDLCPRLHTNRDLAFIYDPIFLEARSDDKKKSYILDWGTKALNESLKNFLSRNAFPFHTFVFPVEKKRWYYIGAHTWRVVELWSIWPGLGEKSKEKIVHKLLQRGRGEHAEDVIAAALASGSGKRPSEMDLEIPGELTQFCVEISSSGHWQRSAALAKKMGYKPPRSRG
ncbi:hypothetical protein H0H81_003105, partial [Sphagnurus paluster]